MMSSSVSLGSNVTVVSYEPSITFSLPEPEAVPAIRRFFATTPSSSSTRIGSPVPVVSRTTMPSPVSLIAASTPVSPPSALFICVSNSPTVLTLSPMLIVATWPVESITRNRPVPIPSPLRSVLRSVPSPTYRRCRLEPSTDEDATPPPPVEIPSRSARSSPSEPSIIRFPVFAPPRVVSVIAIPVPVSFSDATTEPSLSASELIASITSSRVST